MATNAEKLDQLMGRLGQRKSTTVRAALVDELNTAIEDREMDPFIPWFLEKTTTLEVSAGDTAVDLPTGFLREREETLPYYVLEGKVIYLDKKLIGALPGYDTIKTGPRVYALSGGKFHFRPAATEAYSITFQYYAKADDPIADNANPVSNPWLLNAYEYITYSALVKVATLHLLNEKAGANFLGLAREARNKLYAYHESRIHENQDYFVGGASGT